MFIVILLVFFTVVVLISLLPLYNRTVYFLIPETFLKLTTASLFFTLTVSFVTFFGFTVTVILDITPELSAAEAVIMVFPACLAVIFPLSLFMEATFGFDDFQLTAFWDALAGATTAFNVVFCPSVSVFLPLIATFCTGIGFVWLTGSVSGSVMDTVILQEACKPFCVFAVIIVSPAAIAVTIPAASTEATEGTDELQVTDVSAALLGSMEAVSCALPPASSVRVS